MYQPLPGRSSDVTDSAVLHEVQPRTVTAAAGGLAFGVLGALAFGLAWTGAGKSLRQLPAVLPDFLAPSASSLASATPALEWTPDQPAPWERNAFEAHLEFRMPYMNFAQEVYVHSDAPRGRMRIQYYSGANVGLIHAGPTKMSYEMNPVGDRLACLQTPGVKRVEHVVPDLSVFLKHGKRHKVDLVDENGVHSSGIEFKLVTSAPVTSHSGNFTYEQGLSSWLYAGRYSFIVNATAGGVPVNMTFRGHNVMLVNSHVDDYAIVYRAFYLRPEGIDDNMFFPPLGMPCIPFQNAVGPFLHKQLQRGLAMVMPHVHSEQRQPQQSESRFADQELRHRAVTENLEMIHSHNRRGLSYSLGVNHMLDWTDEERATLRGHRPRKDLFALADDDPTSICKIFDGLTANMSQPLPSRIDWREHGLVTPPKDQGTCGSCWTFGAVGAVEGQVAKHLGRALRHDEILSEQHLLDCSWKLGNLGCDGGDSLLAYVWLLQKNKGQLATDHSYGHYLNQDGFCQFDESSRSASSRTSRLTGLRITGSTIRSCWTVVAPKGHDPAPITRRALASVGPLAVSINADLPDFYYYASGVYDNPKCKGGVGDLNHVVVLVGYGKTEGGEQYWIIKNSWSSHWGEGGFGRVAVRGNICGVMTVPVFALL
eukprot:TRINITY_DN61826_c0_g1_i1.p1 TRINITY_DN61826_c0_g1~~TRINITY_DN61826_c0_g1_i1.p1  ORF type:complete len:652 (-),score=99.52 TRINITY_DN61826_c0_g1_i1:175-2130(-)